MIPGDLVFWSSTKIVARVGLVGWLSDEIKKKKSGAIREQHYPITHALHLHLFCYVIADWELFSAALILEYKCFATFDVNPVAF